MHFAFSDTAQSYIHRLQQFMDEHVIPAESIYFSQLKRGERPWTVPPIMVALKAKARAEGLWNLFLAKGDHGAEFGQGLSNADYAPLAEIMGRSFIAPEVFNCNAPDTGNMEVLITYGSAEQKQRWVQP